jgi:hypothetical protein
MLPPPGSSRGRAVALGFTYCGLVPVPAASWSSDPGRLPVYGRDVPLLLLTTSYAWARTDHCGAVASRPVLACCRSRRLALMALRACTSPGRAAPRVRCRARGQPLAAKARTCPFSVATTGGFASPFSLGGVATVHAIASAASPSCRTVALSFIASRRRRAVCALPRTREPVASPPLPFKIRAAQCFPPRLLTPVSS